MKTTFTEFLTESFEFSIPHLEDLDLETFIQRVSDIQKFKVVQKLDGANLRGGIDMKGKLYTTREQKGGKRFYTISDFPGHSSFDGFKAAHLALKKVESKLKKILDNGDAFNLEIIYGDQPNTIFYGKGGLSYIAFLEMLPGDDPSKELDQGKVDLIIKELSENVSVSSKFSDTTDGASIVRSPKTVIWKFIKSDNVPSKIVSAMNFETEIKSLKKFLSAKNKEDKTKTNEEVMVSRTHDLKDEKNRIQDRVMNDYKMPIKTRILDLISKIKPSMRGSIGSKGSFKGIEGIIFANEETGEKFKVVDKEEFTKINRFNYKVRDTISNRAVTNDDNAAIEDRGGILGVAKARCVDIFGINGLELPSQTKKILRKFKGDTKAATIKNLADSLHQLDFQSLLRKFQAVYIATLEEIDESLDSFKKSVADYELELRDGTKVKYTAEVRRRTLMSFAEARNTIKDALKNIRKAERMEDLIEFYFGSQIEDIQEEK